MSSAVDVGLTESLIKAFEGDSSVEVCVEILKGRLGDNLSLTIEADSRNESGMNCYQLYINIIIIVKNIRLWEEINCT